MRPTKPFEIHSPHERIACLPSGHSVLAVADAARNAALDFCTASQFGWGRDALMEWLNGDYRNAISAAGDAPTFDGSEHGAEADEEGDRHFDDATIAGLVRRARGHVADMIAVASTAWRAPGFAREMIDAGFVIGVTDEDGCLGYAPRHRPDARLVDRVTSLFLADFLTRPRDYESLLVCNTCSEISFTWDEVHAHDCDARGPMSGIVVKRSLRWTRLGLGDRRSR